MNDKLNHIYLLGGGWRPEGFENTYGRFIEAASGPAGRKIALVVCLEDESESDETVAAFRSPFESLGVGSDEIVPLTFTEGGTLRADRLASIKPTGLFVCGGLTPLYQSVLCRDTAWLDYLVANDLPYGGFSAGASIAARRAIVGGWQLDLDGARVPIVDEEVSENLDLLTVRDGLCLLSDSVDVHCGQWGTITRLIHAVERGMSGSGLGIDEDTMIQIEGGRMTVHGFGQVYRVRRASAGGVSVEIVRAGDAIDV